MHKIIVAGIVAAVVAAPALARNPRVGESAPPLAMTLFDETQVTLADQLGKVVLINLWATWCAPCKAEMPLINTYYQIYKPHGFEVFAITTEDSVPASMLKPLARVLAIPLVRRKRGNMDVIDHAVPTTYIVDRAGIVRYAKAGVVSLDTLNTVVVPLLNEPAAPAAGL